MNSVGWKISDIPTIKMSVGKSLIFLQSLNSYNSYILHPRKGKGSFKTTIGTSVKKNS